MLSLNAIIEWIAAHGLPSAFTLLLIVGFLISRVMLKKSLQALNSSGLIGKSAGRSLLSIGRALLAIVFVILILESTGIIHQAWAILSTALAALAVGFVAFWSVLSNITAAILLLLLRPFRIKDKIQMMDSDKTMAEGTVVDIDLLFVTLKDDTHTWRIPNNFFLQRVLKIENVAASASKLAETDQESNRSTFTD